MQSAYAMGSTLTHHIGGYSINSLTHMLVKQHIASYLHQNSNYVVCIVYLELVFNPKLPSYTYINDS